jgi:hypothetical protein
MDKFIIPAELIISCLVQKLGGEATITQGEIDALTIDAKEHLQLFEGWKGRALLLTLAPAGSLPLRKEL